MLKAARLALLLMASDNADAIEDLCRPELGVGDRLRGVGQTGVIYGEAENVACVDGAVHGHIVDLTYVVPALRRYVRNGETFGRSLARYSRD